MLSHGSTVFFAEVSRRREETLRSWRRTRRTADGVAEVDVDVKIEVAIKKTFAYAGRAAEKAYPSSVLFFSYFFSGSMNARGDYTNHMNDKYDK